MCAGLAARGGTQDPLATCGDAWRQQRLASRRLRRTRRGEFALGGYERADGVGVGGDRDRLLERLQVKAGGGDPIVLFVEAGHEFAQPYRDLGK